MKSKGKYPMPPPLATAEEIAAPSELGFQVEFRDGYYYIAAVPPGCKDLKVGDRVLEINGVRAFNFGTTTHANALFDTVCMVYIPKEELIRKTNGKKKYHDDDDTTSSEETTVSRQGRRSIYEEQARQVGARRASLKNIQDAIRKEQQDEKALRQIEREIRQLERADRERRADQERMRSQVAATGPGMAAIPPPPSSQRTSILLSPPMTPNKKALRSSIMESITKSPSASERKSRASMIELRSPSASDRKQTRHSIGFGPTPSQEEPLKTKEKKKNSRRSSSPLSLTSSDRSKKSKDEKKKRRSAPLLSSGSDQTKKSSEKKNKRRSGSPASVSRSLRSQQRKSSAASVSSASSASSIISEVPKKSRASGSSVSSIKSEVSSISEIPKKSSTNSLSEIPKKSRPRLPTVKSANAISDIKSPPQKPKRRSSVMVERKVRELEARASNAGKDLPLSPDPKMKIKTSRGSSVKIDRSLGSYGGSSKGWSKVSSSHKSNG